MIQMRVQQQLPGGLIQWINGQEFLGMPGCLFIRLALSGGFNGGCQDVAVFREAFKRTIQHRRQIFAAIVL